MVFSSAIFLFIFLPIVVIAYYLLPKRWRNCILLIASILFYTWGEPFFILILLASITLDYFIAKAIPTREGRSKRRLLTLSIIVNLGLLGYFKYANFFIENVQQFYQLLGLTPFEWSKVALPIGISFATFQKISYMVDVYRGDHEPQQRWDHLCLYILMFPQLIAGPIIRYKDIATQLTCREECATNRLNGLYRFLWGLSKKVLIANVLAEQVDLIFAMQPASISTGTAWLGMIAYTMQIYFDFSGYSDMALGLGKMFGFTFPENFNFPYISKSFTEFWKRWHITLGNWMMDYLYIPLGGNRISQRRTYLNLIIVFLLSGLWHGAAWTFVAWGAYHGLFLVLDKLGGKKILNKIGTVPATLFTFLFVMIGWVIFRADTIGFAGAYIGRLFAFQSFADNIVFNGRFFLVLAIAIVGAFLGISSSIENRVNQFFHMERKTWQWFVLSILVSALYILDGSSILAGGFNPFIYFRF